MPAIGKSPVAGYGGIMRAYMRVVLFIGACLATAATADAQTQSAAIDRLFAPWSKSDTPGCSVAVMKNGHIVFERGYGMADLDHDVRITPATVFDVGSIAKQFTAAAIFLLAQEGKLSPEAGGKRPATRDTLFQAAAISNQSQQWPLCV
jgi:CubicO group peptidase (beta-lactamase class C family)